MKDERIINASGLVKRELSIYAIILAVISFMLKLFINESLIIIDAMPEIILIVGLLIANFTKPSDEVIDERITKDINNHYNNAFKIILPLTLIGYVLSAILLIKTEAALYVEPNFFLNGFIFLIFIGIIILVKKYNVYLNGKILEEKWYFLKVFKVIGYGFIASVGLSVIMIMLNYIIPGPIVPNIIFILMFLLSFINLSMIYFLYSIYEYNHYKESLKLAEGNIFIVSKNMFLYLGITLFWTIFNYSLTMALYYYLWKPTLSNVKFLEMLGYVSFTYAIEKLIFLVIIAYSLRSSLKRLKDHSLSLIKSHTIIVNIYVIISALIVFINKILIYVFREDFARTMLLHNINLWVSLIMAMVYLAILVIRYIYAKRSGFPNSILLIVPMIIIFIPVILNLFRESIIRHFQSFAEKVMFYSSIIVLVSELLVYIIYFYLTYRYAKTFEVKEELKIDY